MKKEIFNALQVKYIKLFFTLQFKEDSYLPEYKESALRGGMGEMLLRANCVMDRNCKQCDFLQECIVHRTMYSHYMIQPPFVKSGDSIGYVIYCDDHRTHILAGDTLEFELILFGNAIVYFNQFVQAFYALGINGLGHNASKFDVLAIKNQFKQPILFHGNINMNYFIPETIHDYVLRRYSMFETSQVKLEFLMPLTLKNRHEFMKVFDIVPILTAIKRRIYMMNCYIGKDVEAWYKEPMNDPPILLQQTARRKGITRYSSTQGKKMTLNGIEGYLNIKNISDSDLCLLLAGELLHIGKNTSFGFGRYTLQKYTL